VLRILRHYVSTPFGKRCKVCSPLPKWNVAGGDRGILTILSAG
jgi:hypothetical protein